MTTHTLNAFRSSSDLQQRADCTFCQIAAGSQSAHLVYSDEATLAFLDILPIRKGHTLVVLKEHVENVSSLSDEQASSMAKTMVKVSRGLGKAMGDERMQVITNQGYAQIVPHIHFHLVPAPPLPGSGSSSNKSSKAKKQNLKSNPMTLIGHGREELDDDEAEELAGKIRRAIQEEADEVKAKL